MSKYMSLCGTLLFQTTPLSLLNSCEEVGGTKPWSWDFVEEGLRSLMEELISQILKELCDYFSVDIVSCERINIIEIQSL